jgi:hypothetical protein
MIACADMGKPAKGILDTASISGIQLPFRADETLFRQANSAISRSLR